MIRKLIVIRGVLELQSKLFRTDSLINTNATHQIIMVLRGRLWFSDCQYVCVSKIKIHNSNTEENLYRDQIQHSRFTLP